MHHLIALYHLVVMHHIIAMHNYYNASFLYNCLLPSGLEMTKMQGSDELFDDVKLPVWANSPSAFIHKHMDALVGFECNK